MVLVLILILVLGLVWVWSGSGCGLGLGLGPCGWKEALLSGQTHPTTDHLWLAGGPFGLLFDFRFPLSFDTLPGFPKVEVMSPEGFKNLPKLIPKPFQKVKKLRSLENRETKQNHDIYPVVNTYSLCAG